MLFSILLLLPALLTTLFSHLLRYSKVWNEFRRPHHVVPVNYQQFNLHEDNFFLSNILCFFVISDLCKWTNEMHFFIFIYSTIFMSILHVSNNLVLHHQEFIVVYCFTQLCTIVQICPAAAADKWIINWKRYDIVLLITSWGDWGKPRKLFNSR